MRKQCVVVVVAVAVAVAVAELASRFGEPSPLTTASAERGHKALQQQTVRDPKYNNNKNNSNHKKKLFVPCSNEVYDLAHMRFA